MISFAWLDTLPSDFALPAGEWAGVRMSFGAERKHVEARRKDNCSTFLFRVCGGQVLRLVVSQDQPKPSLVKRLTMAAQIKALVDRHKADIEHAVSTVTFGIAAELFPPMVSELRGTAQNRRCEGCTCILRADGPLNPETAQGHFIAAQIAGSETLTSYAARVKEVQ